MPLDEKDRARMEQRIIGAFRSVSRAGGVSWSEALAIDRYGGEDERAAARAKDTERGWKFLVDDPDWEPDTGMGGFSFLDPIGFRYYLAPAMIRALRTGEDNGVCFHLTLPPPKDALREHTLGKWSMLDSRQRACVAAFLRFMAEWTDQQVWGEGIPWWRDALTSHWDKQAD